MYSTLKYDKYRVEDLSITMDQDLSTTSESSNDSSTSQDTQKHSKSHHRRHNTELSGDNGPLSLQIPLSGRGDQDEIPMSFSKKKETHIKVIPMNITPSISTLLSTPSLILKGQPLELPTPPYAFGNKCVLLTNLSENITPRDNTSEPYRISLIAKTRRKSPIPPPKSTNGNENALMEPHRPHNNYHHRHNPIEHSKPITRNRRNSFDSTKSSISDLRREEGAKFREDKPRNTNRLRGVSQSITRHYHSGRKITESAVVHSNNEQISDSIPQAIKIGHCHKHIGSDETNTSFEGFREQAIVSPRGERGKGHNRSNMSSTLDYSRKESIESRSYSRLRELSMSSTRNSKEGSAEPSNGNMTTEPRSHRRHHRHHRRRHRRDEHRKTNSSPTCSRRRTRSRSSPREELKHPTPTKKGEPETESSTSSSSSSSSSSTDSQITLSSSRVSPNPFSSNEGSFIVPIACENTTTEPQEIIQCIICQGNNCFYYATNNTCCFLEQGPHNHSHSNQNTHCNHQLHIINRDRSRTGFSISPPPPLNSESPPPTITPPVVLHKKSFNGYQSHTQPPPSHHKHSNSAHHNHGHHDLSTSGHVPSRSSLNQSQEKSSRGTQVELRETSAASTKFKNLSTSAENLTEVPLPSIGDLVGDEIEPARYLIKEPIGRGAFGSVFNAWDQVRNEDVALKFVAKSGPYYQLAKNEIRILELLNSADPNGDFNTQRIMYNHNNGTSCWFVYKEAYVCIVTELLSDSLYTLLEKTSFYGVSLRLIRKFARQILRALAFYSSPDVCVVHCDLKPENILMCSHKKPDVKIIDFGGAICSGGVLHKYTQSRFYRAPEVILRLPYGHPVDMWSLACILFELHVGTPLFQGRNEGEQIAEFVSYLGMPPEEMIMKSPVAADFFEPSSNTRSENYFALIPEIQNKCFPKTVFDALGVDSGGPDGRRALEPGHTRNDYLCFLDLLNRMLVYDTAERITPQQALKHRFFTGAH